MKIQTGPSAGSCASLLLDDMMPARGGGRVIPSIHCAIIGYTVCVYSQR